MRQLSIARVLRLTLLGLTLVLAAIAAIGVGGLYGARQRYETTLADTGALSTAAANLGTASVVIETVVWRLPGHPSLSVRQTAMAYRVAERRALSLARGDRVSLRLVRREIGATSAQAALAAAAAVQRRQRVRELAAQRIDRDSSRRALVVIGAAGLVALAGALALVALLIRSVRGPLDALVEATQAMAAGDLRRRVRPDGPAELRELSEAFNRMGADLEAAAEQTARLDRAKSDFIATASHELRSPLTSIKGFIELLAASPGDMSARQREFVSIILRSADRLVELVDDLLDVARLDADSMELHRGPVDVGELLYELAELVGPRVDGRRQRLEVVLAPALVPAWADPARLRQIVSNLLTNAMLYSGEGARLRLHADARDGRVRISVADTGPGIAPDALEQIYERFYRAGAVESAGGGSGLGLSIVRSLVELHDGWIEVVSELGRGTTFRVSLPAAPSGGGDQPSAVEALRGRRVLVVDDDPAIARLIADQLAPFDVDGAVAHSAREALARLAEERFDAITLDVRMPEMTGLELLEVIRADPERAGTPIVFVSVATASPALAGEWIVSKPVDPDALVRVLASAVAMGRTRALVVAPESLRDRLGPALRGLGVTQHWEHSSIGAARACREQRFEVALVDVSIPNPQAVLAGIALRGRRRRRAVVLISDGGPVPPAAAQLGLEVVSLDGSDALGAALSRAE